MQPYVEHGRAVACCLQLAEQFSIPDSHEDIISDGVKAMAQTSVKGFVSILQVKSSKALYPKECIKEILKDVPGGSTLY